MKERMKIVGIPIYKSFFMINISSDIGKARNGYEEYFGPCSMNTTGVGALSSCKGGNFGIFLKYGWDLSHGNISHEILHTTFNIMERIGHEVTSEGQEPHCYLNGFLTDIVYKQLKSWKIKIK